MSADFALAGRTVPEWTGKTADSKPPKSLLDRLFLRQGGKCAISGRKIRPGDSTHADHIKALKDGLERFATGTYMLWYPEVQRPESRRLPDALKRIPVKDWLHVALTVKTPDESGLGLHGSGLYIINPPWTLAGMLRKFMPGLTKALAQDASAAFVLETGEK